MFSYDFDQTEWPKQIRWIARQANGSGLDTYREAKPAQTRCY
ncbi:hypothetical protein BVI434_410093 [Burkholderia vietnamiensis]|nr:hypothetical protein BVI434_410093 [Burkholderia vietnamiensis]